MVSNYSETKHELGRGLREPEGGAVRKAFTLLLCILAFAVAPAHSAGIEGLVVARGSIFLPGGDLYNGNTKVLETKTLILPRGSTLSLLNLDVEAHNVHSGDPTVDGEPTGLFESDDASFRQQVQVHGVELLGPGEYRFFCTLHPAKVTGTLVIV